MHKKNGNLFAINIILVLMILFVVSNVITIYNYPKEINLMQGHSQRLQSSPLYRLVLENVNQSSINLSRMNSKLSTFTLINGNEEGSANAILKVFNLLPVKNIKVNVIPDIKLIPSGEAIGVKIQTKGVLVVGLSTIIASDGKKLSPAADAGFEVGDAILEINNHKIQKDREITKIVNENHTSDLNFVIERNGQQKNIKVKPIQSMDDGMYRIGLWVRDNIAGIGTMTFYDLTTNSFGALGHGITDIDSGVLVDISKGTVLKSKVASVQKARKTAPGEIVGIFYETEEPYGIISKNSSFGIYGKLKSNQFREKLQALPIALSYQVKEGPAKILSTINGSQIEEFDIEIQKVNRQSVPNSKSMLIKVTDKKLLEVTGGIVQGMSGSPIIQDGKFVGAVTHVLVNDPTRGYGIFIEWMIEETDIQLEGFAQKASGQ